MNSFRIASVLLASTLLAAPVLLAQEPNPIPQVFHNIYPKAANAHSQVDEALALATQQHKRVIFEFGNNQSPDCQVLSEYLHTQPNQSQIAEHFLLVLINVGPKLDQNLDLARRFGVPLDQGVPALSVVDGSGHVLHAQANGEFKNARNMSVSDVTEFLNKWRS